MAVDTFIPEVWSAELLTALERRYVFAQEGLANRDYEGDISAYGDTVHIGSLADPTISNYVKNSTKIDPQTLTTTDQTLLIDQAKYFAFEVDDVDYRQARSGGELLTKAALRSAKGLANTADRFIAGLVTTQAGTILDPATAGSSDELYLIVRKLRLALDKKDVPEDDRFLVVAPEAYAVLLGDNRFIDASAYGSTRPILNGEVGSILGFRVAVSNNLPEGTPGVLPAVSNFMVAGHPMGTTFAEQINKVEAYRPQDSFSDAIKGLHLYGCKVVRPECLAVIDLDVTVGLSSSGVAMFDPTSFPKAGATVALSVTGAAKSKPGTVDLFKGASGGASLQNFTFNTDASGNATKALTVAAITDAGAYRFETKVDGKALPNVSVTVTA